VQNTCKLIHTISGSNKVMSCSGVYQVGACGAGASPDDVGQELSKMGVKCSYVHSYVRQHA
jgi:hypothetical protein